MRKCSYYRTKGEFKALLEGLGKHGYRNVFALTEDSADRNAKGILAATVGPEEAFLICTADVGETDKVFRLPDETGTAAAAYTSAERSCSPDEVAAYLKRQYGEGGKEISYDHKTI